MGSLRQRADKIEGFETIEIIGIEEGDAVRAKVIGRRREELKYSYDNNGNLIGTEDSKGKTVLEYDYMKTDSLNSLNQTAHGHNLHIVHLEGDILKKHQMDRKEIYLYDGLHIIGVYDGNTMALKVRICP